MAEDPKKFSDYRNRPIRIVAIITGSVFVTLATVYGLSLFLYSLFPNSLAFGFGPGIVLQLLFAAIFTGGVALLIPFSWSTEVYLRRLHCIAAYIGLILSFLFFPFLVALTPKLGSFGFHPTQIIVLGLLLALLLNVPLLPYVISGNREIEAFQPGEAHPKARPEHVLAALALGPTIFVLLSLIHSHVISFERELRLYEIAASDGKAGANKKVCDHLNNGNILSVIPLYDKFAQIELRKGLWCNKQDTQTTYNRTIKNKTPQADKRRDVQQGPIWYPGLTDPDRLEHPVKPNRQSHPHWWVPELIVALLSDEGVGMKADPIKALIHYERTLRNLEPYIDNEEETDRRFQILTYVMTAVRLAEYYHGEEAKPEEHQLALELLGKANNAAAKIPQVDPTDTTTYLSKTPNIYISKVTNWIEETSKRVKLENGKVSVNGWNKKP